jgi:hypothetical protein
MRLLHTITFEFKEFLIGEHRWDHLPPAYAILSHCWTTEEISYHDLLDVGSRMRIGPGWNKILDCCTLARSFGYEWAWIDTCCIDKSSSAELSEAINSMFEWYKQAGVCLVFLSDLHQSGDLAQCRWFTRGWTLQELLAPSNLYFYDATLSYAGSKKTLADELASITQIPVEYLTGVYQLKDASVAQRMSWASSRSTTRIEDTAYCLLGLFDISMPLLYGEGRKAFQRLQQAIINQLDDESIFAWSCGWIGCSRGMLACHPSAFKDSRNVRSIYFDHKRPPSTFTSRGLEIHYSHPHPLFSSWEKFCKSFFGKNLYWGSEAIQLRLDCEKVDAHGDAYWIGVSLHRDSATGTWYRGNPSKLLYAEQSTFFRKRYPPFLEWNKIYVAEPRTSREESPSIALGSQSVTPSESAGKSSYHGRSISTHLVWQAAHILSGTFWIWLMCSLHHVFGLRDANGLLSWAYLTAAWHLQGQHTDFTAGVMILGLCGWGFYDRTYDTHNIWSALLSFAPMFCLQVYMDRLTWRNST